MGLIISSMFARIQPVPTEGRNAVAISVGCCTPAVATRCWVCCGLLGMLGTMTIDASVCLSAGAGLLCCQLYNVTTALFQPR